MYDRVRQKLNLSDWQKTDRHIINLFVKSPTLNKRLSYNYCYLNSKIYSNQCILNCVVRMQSLAGWWAIMCLLAATISTSTAQREYTSSDLNCDFDAAYIRQSKRSFHTSNVRNVRNVGYATQ